uniref:hypothetical protein n=1 Tax=Haramonas pauciplastida TaxID=478668 RepID=UPI002113A9CD|nr:hypothetical protein NQY21_pgp145 [Haramonas pauciplastida]UTE94940.1 hypothetical protein HaraPt_p029 [Haramonas pauciplastida]
MFLMYLETVASRFLKYLLAKGWFKLLYAKAKVFFLTSIPNFAFDFLTKYAPPNFFWHVRRIIIYIEKLVDFKMTLGWFPHANLYSFPWYLITLPMDFLFMPLYKSNLRAFKISLAWPLFIAILKVSRHLAKVIAQWLDKGKKN